MEGTSKSTTCSGCGAYLQSFNEHLPGYIPPETSLREPPLCRRCYRIRHYGDIQVVEVSTCAQEEEIRGLTEQPGLVLYVIDGFDIQGSLIEGLTKYTGNHEVMVIVNKTDVFPKEVKLYYLKEWVNKLVIGQGITPKGVLFVSAKSGVGMDKLINLLETTKGKTAYVLGRANVGKSTLLNRLSKQLGSVEPFTTSRVPGTTLGLAEVHITLPSGRFVDLVDVPGLIQSGRITDVLCPDCLHAVLPNSRLRPRVFQLNPGQSLWIGGLARFDFKEGAPQSVVCYVSNDLVIHRTKLERAGDFGREHMEDILQIPCTGCRQKMGELHPAEVTIGRSETQKQASVAYIRTRHAVDIVLPGLGWLALAGSRFQGTLWSSELMHVQTRPRLLGGLTRGPFGRDFSRANKSTY